MKIDNENYSIEYLDNCNKVIFRGILRHQSIEEYDEISNFLNRYAKNSEEYLIIDISNLSYINSSAIASLCLFFIKIRNTGIKFKILALKFVPWQNDLLSNLQHINENIEIEYIIQH
jgi:hypothetical protein